MTLLLTSLFYIPGLLLFLFQLIRWHLRLGLSFA